MRRNGPSMTFVVDEIEVGRRAAVRQSNEDEGWGPWIDTSRMFTIPCLGITNEVPSC